MSLLLREKNRLWTRNAVPGAKVYGETLRRTQGHEYRAWSARRSKLAAYLEKGGQGFQPRGDETVLYLGAASGSTVSHLSDLMPKGRIVAVEFSPRPFRDLLQLAAMRDNILPVLSDAHDTDAYDPYVSGRVPLIVQDIAQRDQGEIFLKNMEKFAAKGATGILAVKSRSVDVAAPPRDVYARVKKQLATAGYNVREVRELDPYEKDHAVIVVQT